MCQSQLDMTCGDLDVFAACSARMVHLSPKRDVGHGPSSFLRPTEDHGLPGLF